VGLKRVKDVVGGQDRQTWLIVAGCEAEKGLQAQQHQRPGRGARRPAQPCGELTAPARRSTLIARLHSVALTRGPDPVRT
jgi:hypothetical protein